MDLNCTGEKSRENKDFYATNTFIKQKNGAPTPKQEAVL
jgi:hypothetical protein